MGVPTSEVGYTSAMPRREDHEVHKDMWGHWKKIFRATGNIQSRILHRRALGPEYKQAYFIQNFLLVWKEDAWTQIIFTN